MNWKRYLFDFNSHYRDQNLIFVYDKKRSKFFTNEIFVKIANIINDNYLSYGEDINTNDMFNEWTARTDNNKPVLGNLADYEELNLDEKTLTWLVQFNIAFFIRRGREFYTSLKDLRGTTNSMLQKCQNIGRVDLMSQQLIQLRKDLKNLF